MIFQFPISYLVHTFRIFLLLQSEPTLSYLPFGMKRMYDIIELIIYCDMQLQIMESMAKVNRSS